MAEILGIKRTTYAHIEAYGSFKPEQIETVADYFNIPVSVLFKKDLDDIPNNQTNPTNSLDYNSLSPMEQNLIDMFRKLSIQRQKDILYEIMNG